MTGGIGTPTAAAARRAGTAGPARDLLIYVNVPFCRSKCHFCFWVAQIPRDDLRLREGEGPRAGYVAAVRRQIADAAPRLRAEGYRPNLMYWGGGTATDLSVREFWCVADALREQFDLGGLAEATMEGSPETLTAEKLAAYRSAGFDRMSIGVQSFDDRRLAALGRAHRADVARRAVRMAHDAGFREINIDLMCGLPDETLDEFEQTVRTALTLPVTHVSLYPYRPIDDTVGARGVARGSATLDARERRRAYALGRDLLEAAGLPEYCFSYFGRRPCAADLAYYSLRSDYVGFGAGARSLLNGEHLVAPADLREYTADPVRPAAREPAVRAAPRHLLTQSLGLFDGIDARLWAERLRVPFDAIAAEPGMAAILARLERDAGLVRDRRGARLPRDQMLRVLVEGG